MPNPPSKSDKISKKQTLDKTKIVSLAMAVKKGDLVRAIREKLENSLEAQASDTRFPPYLFETKGEIVDAKGDYVLVKFGYVPTPNIWLRADQLEKVD